jgi:hypothetical protein
VYEADHVVVDAATAIAVMMVASAAPAFARNNGNAWGWGANPGLCEAYAGNGCGWHGHP